MGNRRKTDRTILREDYRQGMEQFKYEVASTLGLPDYNRMDKGNLPSRANGYVGGNMVKTMISFAEEAIGSGTARPTHTTNDGQQYIAAILDPAIMNILQSPMLNPGGMGNQGRGEGADVGMMVTTGPFVAPADNLPGMQNAQPLDGAAQQAQRRIVRNPGTSPLQ